MPKISSRRPWKFLALGKGEKTKLEGWASDVAVDQLGPDNQSLPSTSQLHSNCTTPKMHFDKLESADVEKRLEEALNEKVLVTEKESELI